jgi:hypothetical protein
MAKTILEQKEYKEFSDYTLYPNSQYGAAYNTRFSGNGLNPGQIPWNKLSYNAADTESFLFGVNSTNLVNPAGPLRPELKTLGTANFFEKTPTLMPEPMAIEKNQRPFPTPN